jgi:truncated hemoglobin YjbI
MVAKARFARRADRRHAPGVTDFDRIGGAAALRPIIDEFVDRCFDDLMIGFFFARADRARVKRFEYEHAAEHLGAGTPYGGRPLAVAHGAHRIMGGQFDRRLTILREVLEAHGVPEDIRSRWLAHHEGLRAEITADPRGRCEPGGAGRSR